MNKNKYRPVITIAFLICVLGYKLAFSQDTTSYKNKFLGRWVNYYGYRQDTIVYIPYHSPLAENISHEVRYSGITFKDDNKYIDHSWKMCGNDDGPDFYPGTWRLDKLNNRTILSMIDIDKQSKNYIIIEVVKDKIVLVPTQ